MKQRLRAGTDAGKFFFDCVDRLVQVYEDFTKHVAESRELTMEEVDALARGRVWTGAQVFLCVCFSISDQLS